MSDDFVHLHVHTDYSMLDGAAKIDKLVDETVRQGQKAVAITDHGYRSEEHTSELQSRGHLVCRLLLEKKKKRTHKVTMNHIVINTRKNSTKSIRQNKMTR